MTKSVKKLSAIVLSVTTAVWLSGAAFIVPTAQAQTADLQALIDSLSAQVAFLQARLTALQNGTTVPASACSFTRNLTVGSTGDDVKCLQQYLNGAGHQVSATGAGSPGSESTYFGSLTRAALAKWQAANAVAPDVGYFGPISKAKYTNKTAVTVVLDENNSSSTVSVSSSLFAVSFILDWSGGELELALIDPNGRRIDKDTVATDVTYKTRETQRAFTITKPVAGSWTLVTAIDVPPEGEAFTLTTLVESTLTAQLFTNVLEVTPPIIIINAPEAKAYSYTEDITLDFSATDISGILYVIAEIDPPDTAEIPDTAAITEQEPDFIESGEVINLEDFSLGEHRFAVTAVDNLGNTLTKIRVFTVIDDVAPLSGTYLSGTLGNDNWYGSDVEVFIAAEDEKSGISSIYYCTDQSNTCTPSLVKDCSGSTENTNKCSVTITLDDEGINFARYYAVDEAGNAGSTRSAEVKIDKTPPTITITSPQVNEEFFANAVLNIAYTLDGLWSLLRNLI